MSYSTQPDSKLKVFFIYAIPFIIVNLIIFFLVTSQPRFELHTEASADYKTVNITVSRKSLFPLKSFTVKLDEQVLELEKSGSDYTAVLDRNGTLEVSAVNLNGMTQTLYENINAIDDEPPVIYGEMTDDGMVTLSIEDSQSGIDFTGIYGLNDKNERISPSLTDEGSAIVSFKHKEGTLEVHVSDKAGNESIATFGTEA